jgi:3-oxoacyl-(acyl-carrier-protein) synthase
MDSLELFAEKLVGGNPKFVSPLPFTHSYANAPNSLVAIEFKLRGFNACFTCGHASGMTAIECACQRIELGKDRRLLAGGSESLSEPVFHGYDLRGLLHGGGDPRPYDASSDGMVLGEGAAIFAIEDAEAAAERHATIFARVRGHASAAGPSLADALARAMQGAVAEAEMAPGDVDLIVGVGCGLPEVDSAELQAIRRLFGDARPMLTSVRRMMGEGMGVGGPMSLAAAVIACLEDRAVPPVLLDDTPSPEGVDLVAGESRPADVCRVLVNAADPGGCCVSLLLAFPDS